MIGNSDLASSAKLDKTLKTDVTTVIEMTQVMPDQKLGFLTGRGGRRGPNLAVLATALVCIGGQCAAQSGPFKNGAAVPETETAEAVGVRNGSFIVAPIPFSSPSLGAGLALGGAYLFRADEGSNSSTVGFGAFKSDNDSEGYALGWDVNFGNGEWTTSFLLADANLNYDLYVAGFPIPVSQSLQGYTIGFARSISEQVEIGIGIGYGESEVQLRGGGALPPILEAATQLKLARLTFDVERDFRDDNFYPTTGSLSTGSLIYGRAVDNGELHYGKLVLTSNYYWPVTEKGVLAVRGSVCASTDEAPFFDSCALGGVDAFRGYVATEFIDNALLSAQVEYRGRLTNRLGFVAFAGIGSVGDDFGDALGNDLKVAVGIGARIRLSKTFPVDYAIDLSYNEAQESILYVSVGQRF